MQSHSAWSAWIEILVSIVITSIRRCRTPHGVRGLKSNVSCVHILKASHSAWSAWIEISQAKCCASLALVALRMECVD